MSPGIEEKKEGDHPLCRKKKSRKGGWFKGKFWLVGIFTKVCNSLTQFAQEKRPWWTDNGGWLGAEGRGKSLKQTKEGKETERKDRGGGGSVRSKAGSIRKENIRSKERGI